MLTQFIQVYGQAWQLSKGVRLYILLRMAIALAAVIIISLLVALATVYWDISLLISSASSQALILVRSAHTGLTSIIGTYCMLPALLACIAHASDQPIKMANTSCKRNQAVIKIFPLLILVTIPIILLDQLGNVLNEYHYLIMLLQYLLCIMLTIPLYAFAIPFLCFKQEKFMQCISKSYQLLSKNIGLISITVILFVVIPLQLFNHLQLWLPPEDTYAALFLLLIASYWMITLPVLLMMFAILFTAVSAKTKATPPVDTSLR